MGWEQDLANLRFEGYSHQELADEIDRLRSGPGSRSLYRAVSALAKIATGLAATDMTLRAELAKIGVVWEGAASEGGVDATKQATVFAEDAAPNVAKSAGGVSEQGQTFSNTRNGAPESDALRGPTQTTGLDRFAQTVLGHTTDNAKKVQAGNAAHAQAVNSMNGYSNGSQGALSNYQSLPVPPGLNLHAQPVSPQGVTSAQGFSGTGSAFAPGGGGIPGGGGGGGFNAPGGGGQVQGFNPLTGGNGPGPLPSPVPIEQQPGRVTGVGPLGPGGLPLTNNQAFPGLRPGPIPFGDLAMTAGTAAVTGGAAGSAAEKDRVVRGSGGPGGAGGRVGGPAGVDPKVRPGGGTSIADLPDEESRAARNAEKIGAKPRPGGASLMQPAAAGANGEDDEEHVRKYGIDSDDVFGDDRLVISPVLGEDE